MLCCSCACTCMNLDICGQITDNAHVKVNYKVAGNIKHYLNGTVQFGNVFKTISKRSYCINFVTSWFTFVIYAMSLNQSRKIKMPN